jgi:hypothetical protein
MEEPGVAGGDLHRVHTAGRPGLPARFVTGCAGGAGNRLEG